MKKLITLSALCVAFIACNNNNSNTATDTTNTTDTTSSTNAPASAPFGLVKKHTWADFNLQGKVKEITEYTFLEGQAPEGMPTDTTATEGIRITYFSPEGYVTHITEYEYDLEGPSEHFAYEYNDQHQLTTITFSSDGGGYGETENYKYTPEGFVSSYSIDGYVYMSENNIEKKPSIVTTYTTTPTPDGTEVVIKDDGATETRFYNKQNLLQKRIYCDNAQNKGEAHYSYDSNNRLVKETYEGAGSLFVPTYYKKGTITYQYDKYGNLTQALLEEAPKANAPSDSSMFGNEYTYDAQGNIIRASVNMGQEPLVKIYKITYY